MGQYLSWPIPSNNQGSSHYLTAVCSFWYWFIVVPCTKVVKNIGLHIIQPDHAKRQCNIRESNVEYSVKATKKVQTKKVQMLKQGRWKNQDTSLEFEKFIQGSLRVG